MGKIFRAQDGSLRNGWKAAVYMFGTCLIGFLLWQVVHHMPPEIKKLMQFNWLLPSAIFLGTLAAVRLEKISFASLGLRFDRRFFKQLVQGFIVGLALMSTLAFALWATVGFQMHLAAQAGVMTALSLLWTFLVVGFCEEAFFRGYGMQRAIRGMGPNRAIFLFATIFALAHLGNPGMSGLTAVIAVANIVLAGLMLGYFYLHTRSLALSIGLHTAWNWLQECLGFTTSGNKSQGLIETTLNQAPDWLTGGSFGPESSLLCTVLLSIVVAGQIIWQVRARAMTNSTIGLELAV